jgi:hypothetical protein
MEDELAGIAGSFRQLQVDWLIYSEGN